MQCMRSVALHCAKKYNVDDNQRAGRGEKREGVELRLSVISVSPRSELSPVTTKTIMTMKAIGKDI